MWHVVHRVAMASGGRRDAFATFAPVDLRSWISRSLAEEADDAILSHLLILRCSCYLRSICNQYISQLAKVDMT